ncbi:MAG TPA: S-adenosylmethionine:tRNA ribosyltransferase-isomerase [Polyangiales bacterium]
MNSGKPKRERDETRLLVVDPAQRALEATGITALARFLRRGDVLVLNDAATLPASLFATTERGDAIELRLLGPPHHGLFDAVLFGAGDHRTGTEQRPPPPELALGDTLRVGPRLSARIEARSALSARLIALRFDREDQALWLELYAHGSPVQYAHQPEPLALWSVQTIYAARPWAAEMPSAGRPLSFATLRDLKRRGISIATLTHAAGLSSTGDPAIDRALPLPERYEIPSETVQAIAQARTRSGRVIAVGTSVVRALESAALRRHPLQAGEAISTLRIEAGFARKIVDGLLTGIHAPGESHYDLLSAFVDADLLRASHDEARRLGFASHEFGDSCLILPHAIADRLAA